MLLVHIKSTDLTFRANQQTAVLLSDLMLQPLPSACLLLSFLSESELQDYLIYDRRSKNKVGGVYPYVKTCVYMCDS